MPARIACRIRVGTELTKITELKPRLLLSLPDRSTFQTLAVIDKTAGQRPAVRFVFTLDEDDSFTLADNDIDGWKWV